MLIPDNITYFTSMGEKLLYKRFKEDVKISEMYILHSVFTNHHFSNICGEIDFLILAPNKGIFAIEVKHGGVSRDKGTWFYTSKEGYIAKKNISPFAQVNGTMYSIRNFVLGKLYMRPKLKARISKILWGTGVAFTSMDKLFDFGPEGHSWQVLKKRDLNNPISEYIERLSREWHDQNSTKHWYNTSSSRPTKSDCETLLKILRGDFNIDYSELNKLMDHKNLIEEFTKEQFSLLDFVNYNDRCFIEGSAGTGKTLMALEIAKREIRNGKRVCVFCYNKLLGKKLQHSVGCLCPEDDNNYAGTFHSFLKNNCNIEVPKANIDKFYREDLPLDYLIQNENMDESCKFDILILDESQDLLTSNNIEVFDLILKKGINNGKWVFLGDLSHQAIYNSNPESFISYLHEISIFTRFPPLTVNCRNTRKIAIQNTIVTGSKLPEFTSNYIEGDKVENRFPEAHKQQGIIEKILHDLKAKNIPMSEISLLSPKRFENTFLKDSTLVKNFESCGLTVSTIQAYKGLENSIIILYDFDKIDSMNSIRLFYVGISRARQKLYVIITKDFESDYKKLVRDNLAKLR